jgi:drug/metabolite transporter (DMT)-like permease
MIGTSPFWMVGIDAALRRGRQLFLRQWLGLVTGFAGIVLLVWPDLVSARMPAGFGWGMASIQVAVAGFAFGATFGRGRSAPSDVWGTAAAQMFLGGLLLLVVGTLAGEWPRLALQPQPLIALLYLTLAGSVVAYAAFSYAMEHLDVAIVSLYTYINPIIAIALGTAVLGEPFRVRTLVAAAVILTGVMIVGPLPREPRV